MADNIEIFISYADEDQEYLEGLESQLAPMTATHPITIWHKGKVVPGKEQQREIDTHLKAARVILLLVSASYLASTYLYTHEVQRAIEYKKAGTAEVIPVLLRSVDWEGTLFGQLKPLPTNRKPVKQWRDKDKALYSIALGIRKIVEKLTTQPPPNTSSAATITEEPAKNKSKQPIAHFLPNARSISCVLQLTHQSDCSFLVQAVISDGESAVVSSTLPYTRLQLIAIFKALLPTLRAQYKLTEEQIQNLQQLGLWVQESNRLIVDPVRKVGQDLYNALMVGEVGKVFDRVLGRAISQNVPIALQLRLNPTDVELARYPWELLYHPTYGKLLLSQRVELLRHMTYATEQINPPRVTSPLHVLYISARPRDLSFLPTIEQDNVHQVLKTLQEEGKVTFIPLSPPTFSQLQQYLLKNRVHVLHFDGHGRFGRRCPACKAFNYSFFFSCQNKIGDRLCQESLADVDELGYLSFENDYGREHAISSEELGYLMAGRNIRLALLSTCSSGTIDGRTLLGGTAQVLLKQGVMAAVAPQLPMSPQGSALFARSFYEALAETNSLLVALNRGRQSLLTDHANEWFIPALYTRLGHHRLIDKVFPQA